MIERAEIQTSIGALYVEAQGRDWFTMTGLFESPPVGVAVLPDSAYPHMSLTFENQDGRWVIAGKVDYRAAPRDIAPIPQALLGELSKLGTEWANTHPEAFEQAARAEFDDHIMYIADETFGEIARICGDAHRHIREILGAAEFENHASTALRRRVQKEAQRLRTMRQQVSGAAKAINTLASRRTLGPVNPADQ
jgi:hypothetical protein